MPCISGPSINEESQDRAERIIKAEFEPMLCSACRVLERMGFDFDENPKLSVWWDKHKKDDAEKDRVLQHEAQRKAYRERIAQEALKKPLIELTAEERSILKEFKYL